MTVLPQTPALSLPKQPAGRITLAIILSLLAHAIALFAPLVNLPLREVPRPPILARLELLPKMDMQLRPPEIAAKPAPIKKKKFKPKQIPAPDPVKPEVRPDPQKSDEQPVGEPDIAAGPQQPAVVAVTEEVGTAHPTLPNARLTFAIYKGAGGFQVGESRHKLEIKDRHYTLTATTEPDGIARVFKDYRLMQTSHGTLTRQGIQPDRFSEDKSGSQGTQSLSADFDWDAKTLSFSGGNKAELFAQTQDILSFLYQFSQLSLQTEIVTISISNGKKLERYDFEVGAEELIDTRFGQLRTVKLRKMHVTGEEGTEIWLGIDYRLLPVKIRHIDRAGEISGEMLISEIYVADE